MEIVKTKSFSIAVRSKGSPSASKVAILMPGRLDTKDYANFVNHLDFFEGRGFYAVAIDPPGTWDSPGDLQNYTTTTYLQAINELIDLLGNRPTVLLGHSRGGATAMLASKNPAVVGLVVINAAYGSPHAPKPEKIVDGYYKEHRDTPPGSTRTVEQKHFDLPLNYFEDGIHHDPLGALNSYRGPKLVVHTARDEFAPIERVKAIYDSLNEPKMFVEIDSTHDYRLFPQAIHSVEKALSHFLEHL